MLPKAKGILVITCVGYEDKHKIYVLLLLAGTVNTVKQAWDGKSPLSLVFEKNRAKPIGKEKTKNKSFFSFSFWSIKRKKRELTKRPNTKRWYQIKFALSNMGEKTYMFFDNDFLFYTKRNATVFKGQK